MIVEQNLTPEKVPEKRRVRYTGKAGASVNNDYGDWNIGAPEFLGDSDPPTPHPYAPVKLLTQAQADRIVDDVLFHYDD